MATAALRVPSRWIIGRTADSLCIAGSAGAGYVYLLLNLAFHVPISFLWWFWSIGFDGTHIFATASRTYFDREARSGRGALLWGSLAFFFALGPAMVLCGAKGYLALLVGVWAYYHVVRQHYGVMILYKVKNRDLDPRDNRFDRWLLFVMLICPPFHRFFIHHSEELGIPRGIPGAEPWLWALVVATALAWTARQFSRKGPANLPKLLLFAGVIPLHWLTFATMNWKAAVPTVTIVHNLQYHALVWLHNRNRYAGADASALHGTVPRAASRSLVAYAVMALLFSAFYRIPGFHLGRVSDLAFGFFCGFGLTHYYLDSRIWRVRHDPALRQALELA